MTNRYYTSREIENLQEEARKSGYHDTLMSQIKELERERDDTRDTVAALTRMLRRILDGHLPPCLTIGGDD